MIFRLGVTGGYPNLTLLNLLIQTNLLENEIVRLLPHSEALWGGDPLNGKIPCVFYIFPYRQCKNMNPKYAPMTICHIRNISQLCLGLNKSWQLCHDTVTKPKSGEVWTEGRNFLSNQLFWLSAPYFTKRWPDKLEKRVCLFAAATLRDDFSHLRQPKSFLSSLTVIWRVLEIFSTTS